ncbi:helix-turn-helix transcriptional regulator [Cupriavidus oxalaticus]|uniref:DNA-binding protein n=1 Tax=Cupriavidus oxalaticus TaxID=96344 RepID=A0A5P3VRE3_9BURK|nr:helix-turn-helix domain-containing protein [Cupriavidus oxalaticus]QEZ48944.1 DNA-binding protein [Cupriavidus oxalaticus]
MAKTKPPAPKDAITHAKRGAPAPERAVVSVGASEPAPPRQFGEVLTPKDAAAFLTISNVKLRELDRAGQGPRRTYITPKLVRYRVEDLRAWLAVLAEEGAGKRGPA